MIYTINPVLPKHKYPSIMDILEDREVKNNEPITGNLTKTYCKKALTCENEIDVTPFIIHLESFSERWKHLYEAPRGTLYNTFFIPKRSGGLRQIDAPNEALSQALTELRGIFATHIGNYFHHTCAFAYVKDRCTVDAVKVHQQAGSKWFAKFDFSNFFGSTTKEFVLEMCRIISPLHLVMANQRGETALSTALELCFLNGGLPQGTQMSPFITNMMMIPIDHQLLRYCATQKPHLIYTRYADDIQISCKYEFDFREVEKNINQILSNFRAPFKIKPEKTHYGSSATSNWILGVMLNKENQITIGHRKKKWFKAKLTSFVNDYKNGTVWSIEDTQKLLGEISYYRSIEKDYINYILSQYSNKFECDIERTVKNILKGNIL